MTNRLYFRDGSRTTLSRKMTISSLAQSQKHFCGRDVVRTVGAAVVVVVVVVVVVLRGVVLGVTIIFGFGVAVVVVVRTDGVVALVVIRGVVVTIIFGFGVVVVTVVDVVDVLGRGVVVIFAPCKIFLILKIK